LEKTKFFGYIRQPVARIFSYKHRVVGGHNFFGLFRSDKMSLETVLFFTFVEK